MQKIIFNIVTPILLLSGCFGPELPPFSGESGGTANSPLPHFRNDYYTQDQEALKGKYKPRVNDKAEEHQLKMEFFKDCDELEGAVKALLGQGLRGGM